MIVPIITALRQRCPQFAGRVAGAAEFDQVRENTSLPRPCAYVLPESDKPRSATLSGGYRQEVTSAVSIVLAVDAAADRRAETAALAVLPLRDAVLAALAGWEPPGHGPLEYTGGELISVTSATLWWRMTLAADWVLTGDPSVQETWTGQVLATLPQFSAIHYGVDAIDPADLNTAPQGGPDGRLEGALDTPLDQ